MRRTKASKAIITFGYSDFNVFELVNLLNEIKSQTYQYGVNDGQKKEDQQKLGITKKGGKDEVTLDEDDGLPKKEDATRI